MVREKKTKKKQGEYRNRLMFNFFFYRLRFDDDHVTPVSDREVFEDNFGDEPSRKLSKLSTTPSGKSIPTDATTTPDVSPTETTPPSLVHDRQRLRGNSLRSIKRFTNAYMLVYIQKSKLDQVLESVSDDDIPLHLRK